MLLLFVITMCSVVLWIVSCYTVHKFWCIIYIHILTWFVITILCDIEVLLFRACMHKNNSRNRIHSYMTGLHESLQGLHHNEWTLTIVNIANKRVLRKEHIAAHGFEWNHSKSYTTNSSRYFFKSLFQMSIPYSFIWAPPWACFRNLHVSVGNRPCWSWQRLGSNLPIMCDTQRLEVFMPTSWRFSGKWGPGRLDPSLQGGHFPVPWEEG